MLNLNIICILLIFFVTGALRGVQSGPLEGAKNDTTGTLDDAKQLYNDMLSNYSKYVRPIRKQGDPVNVYITLAAIAIQEFDEVLERFSVVGAIFLNWFDQNIFWDEDNYGGIDSLFIGYKKVWVPEVILTNPSEKLDSFGKEWQLIRYGPSGWASWTPGDLIKATCSIDVRYFPFDIQECGMEMYVWGYLTNEVKLIAGRDTIDTGLMVEHGSWTVLNTSAKVEDKSLVSKATFTFRLKRKPQYVIVNVVLPILFLCLLNVLVFMLPAESGERVSYAITVLLSIAVFMTIVSDILPKTSEPLPIIGYFLMIDLIVSALTGLCTILNLRIYHKKDDVPIPKWLIGVYNFLCCNCRRGTSVGSSELDKSEAFIPFSKDKSNIKQMKKIAFVDQIDSTKDMSGIKFKANIDESPRKSDDIKDITWQDISIMIDYILLIFFAAVTIISFCTFLIITLGQGN